MKKALLLSYVLLAASFLSCDGMEKIREIAVKNWAKACALVSSSQTASKYLKPFIPLTAYPAYRVAVASLARNQKTLSDRPANIQTACDSAFEHNRDASNKDWLYNGTSNYYTLVDLDEDAIFAQLAHKNSGQKDVYVIDAGCAQGRWGRNALEILQNEAYKKSGKHFHIFSVTGGQECDELVKHKDHVTLYQLNQFKIENIDEEFAKRGFDLKNKVDLIVSNWTLRHTLDPFGTVKRMYGLLTPKQGKLMSNGFLFKFDETDKVQTFPQDNENILTASNATCLFKVHTPGRDAGHFLLMPITMINDAKNCIRHY